MTKRNKAEIDISDLQISNRAKCALRGAGVTNIGQLCNQTKQDLLNISGLGRTSLDEILLVLRVLKLKLKKKPKENKETRDVKFEKFLIQRHIKPEKLKFISWGNEIRVARILLNKYPKREFWERYALTFKLNSLLFFLGGGKEALYKAYHSDKAKIPHLDIKELEKKEMANEIVGENLIFEKPRSMEEFLNGY